VKNVIQSAAFEGLTNILLQKFKAWFVGEVRQIRQPPGKEVICDYNGVTFCQ
jgi:hypothetical protein